MFWFKKEPKAPVALPAQEESAGLMRVMDTLASLLREYGKGAFDIEGVRAETVRRQCERWAQHVLVGALRPGETVVTNPLPLERRDFGGVRRFFAEKRSEESAAVARSMGALHQSLWAALKALDGVVAGGDETDDLIGNEMIRLQTIAQDGSAEVIRREVLSVVSHMQQIGRDKALRQEKAVEELKTEVATLGQELEIAWQESAIDPLTRLFNRRAFEERCVQALTMRRLFTDQSSLLMIDLDHFKNINDTFGHVAGDAVLREVADVMARTFPSRRDFVARYGGEEFVVMLWGSPLERARSSADRLVDAVRQHRFEFEKKIIPVTVSIGVAELLTGEDSQAWTARADRALYAAKSAGRNRAVAAT